MEYEIIDNKFIAIKGISHIKEGSLNIIGYEVKNSELKGELQLQVIYYDTSGIENNFETILPVEIFLDDENVTISITDPSFNVIDNQGLEVNYHLIIKSDECEKINTDLDEKLNDYLKNRDESFLEEIEPIKIIDTKENDNIIPNFKDTYHSYKVVYNKEDTSNYNIYDLVIEKNNVLIIKNES